MFSKRLYLALVLSIGVFVFAFIYPLFYLVGLIVFWLIVALTVIDTLILFANADGVVAKRNFRYEKLSNGDENDVFLEVRNNYSFKVFTQTMDELPVQFQMRDFMVRSSLEPGEQKKVKYSLRPLSRGEFHFGQIIVLAQSFLGFVSRRFVFDQVQILPCYPSFLKLNQYELMAITDRLVDTGIKKVRKIGHSSEFDNIKEYVIGNDIRTINWKASARRNQLMVNHFRDERAQQVYALIDMGRIMKMPFDGLSLMDYSINAALVLSHVSYIKHDKPGVITFSNTVHQTVTADRKGNQLFRLQKALYNAKTDFEESNYEVLLNQVLTKVSQRSLLLLFTNFESLNGLKRQLKYIRHLAKHHLVVVIIFENTELHDLLAKPAVNTSEIYSQTIAKKFDYEKTQIAYELQKFGIQCIYTKPKQLTVNTLNKYLELKSRGLM